jgi:RNA polymerase sigma-70 factor (ECF subfamily)
MNTCLDELRRRKNRPNTSLDGLYDAGWSPVDPGQTPEKAALIGDMRRQLQAFIRELPEDMRAAVVLRDVEGYSYDEIASMLDTNVGTIKSRISRGREKLREKIAARPELFDRLDV